MFQSENKKYGYNLLLVDDNQLHQEYIFRVFEDKAYNIYTSSNGTDALKRLKTMRPDLILLDVIMPGLNGFEVCERIKSNKETRNIPVIFLTSKTDKESIVKGFEIGGSDYITIPFNPDELKVRVRTHLELKRRQEELEYANTELDMKVSERTKELENANKMLQNLEKNKADFLTLISYKIRTPLNTIMGFTQILNNTIKDERQRKNLQMIKGASEKLMQIAETANLVTSLSTEKIKANFTEVDIKELLRLTIKELDHELNAKNIVLTTDISNHKINGDNKLLKITFYNILENAVRYSQKNSEIILKAYREEKNSKVQFIDNGPGFADETLNVIKNLSMDEPLRNFDENSFGLGIFTAKIVADLHYGQMQISNNQKSGAAVQFIFPIEETEF